MIWSSYLVNMCCFDRSQISPPYERDQPHDSRQRECGSYERMKIGKIIFREVLAKAEHGAHLASGGAQGLVQIPPIPFIEI